MGLLNKELLLKKQPLRIEKVDLGNGDFVFVKEMTAHEKDLFEQSLRKVVIDSNGEKTYEQSIENFRAKFAVNIICDEKGNLLLKQSDYPALSQNMGSARLETIVEEGQSLNKISEKDKEALVKNSGAARSGDSTSGCVKN
jgi:hypothetical protein